VTRDDPPLAEESGTNQEDAHLAEESQTNQEAIEKLEQFNQLLSTMQTCIVNKEA
jgi:hypothetical protein